MLMKLKNKMTLTLTQLVKKTEKEGGIPSLVEMSIQEGAQLVRELNRMRSDSSIKKRYTVRTQKDELQDARFALFRKEGIDNTEVESFLRSWHEGSHTVEFDGIPLILVIPKKQAEDPGSQATPGPGPQTSPNPGIQISPTPGNQTPCVNNGELTLT